MNVSQVENLISVKISKNQYGVYRTSEKKEREGIIKRNGEIMVPAEGYLSVVALNDHLFDLTNEDLTHATFDTNLNQMLPFVIDRILGTGHFIFYVPLNDRNWREQSFGICDSNYQVLLAPNYERIIYFAETYWIKEWYGCWMVMNEQLKTSFPNVEDVRLLIGAKAKDKSVAIAIDREYFLLSANRERITYGHYEFLEPFTEAGYAIAKVNGKLVIIDEKEQILHSTEYSVTYDGSQPYPYWRFMWVASNRLAFYQDGKYGLMTPEGKVIVEPTYAEILVLGCEELIPVKSTEGLRGYIDINGQIVIPCLYKHVTFNRTTHQFRVKTTDNKYGLFDKNGNPVLPTIFKQITIDEDGQVSALLD